MAVYRLPFESPFKFPGQKPGEQTWTSYGNWDEPSGGHGIDQSGNPTNEQAYAFDLMHDTGGAVLAARAGRVIDCVET